MDIQRILERFDQALNAALRVPGRPRVVSSFDERIVTCPWIALGMLMQLTAKEFREKCEPSELFDAIHTLVIHAFETEQTTMDEGLADPHYLQNVAESYGLPSTAGELEVRAVLAHRREIYRRLWQQL